MKTDRTKHPQCRFCGRTLELRRVPGIVQKTWIHRKSGNLCCVSPARGIATPKAVPNAA